MTKISYKPTFVFSGENLDLDSLHKTDCHVHTNYTDGHGSVSEVYGAAVSQGLTAILFSEHSRKTSLDWFGNFASEVRELPTAPCRAYVGTEVKVESYEGDIDSTPEIIRQCDFVMASVHRFVGPNGRLLPFSEVRPEDCVDIEYALTWGVLENPDIDIIGHIFGMSYRRYGVVPPDEKIKSLIARAAQFGVIVEANSRYHPSLLKIVSWCREFGAQFAFGSNAHALNEVGAVMTTLKKEIDA